MTVEQWALGTATARVCAEGGTLTAVLRGVVTAQAYEALHRRMAAARCRQRTVVIGAALLCATPISLAEAATRGTPAAVAAWRLIIAAHPRRRRWALNHCAALAELGMARVRECCLPGVWCPPAASNDQPCR